MSNEPKKLSAPAKVKLWGNFVVILLAAVLAFMPLFEVSIPAEGFDTSGLTMLQVYDRDHFESGKCEVSLLALAKSGVVLVKAIAFENALPGENQENPDFTRAYKLRDDLLELYESASGPEAFVTAAAVMDAFGHAGAVFELASALGEIEDAEADDVVLRIVAFLLGMVLLVVVFGIIAFAIILPIRMLVQGIQTLVSVLKRRKTLNEALANRLGSVMSKHLVVFTVFAMFLSLTGNLSLGEGAYAWLVLLGVSVVVNVVAGAMENAKGSERVVVFVHQGVYVFAWICSLVLFLKILNGGVDNLAFGAVLANEAAYGTRLADLIGLEEWVRVLMYLLASVYMVFLCIALIDPLCCSTESLSDNLYRKNSKFTTAGALIAVAMALPVFGDLVLRYDLNDVLLDRVWFSYLANDLWESGTELIELLVCSVLIMASGIGLTIYLKERKRRQQTAIKQPQKEAPMEELVIPAQEPAPQEELVIPAQEPAPQEELVIPAQEPAPQEELVIPAQEPAPQEELVIPAQEPVTQQEPVKLEQEIASQEDPE